MNYQVKPEELRTIYKFLFFWKEIYKYIEDEMGLESDNNLWIRIDIEPIVESRDFVAIWIGIKPKWAKGKRDTPLWLSFSVNEKGSGIYENKFLWIGSNYEDIFGLLKNVFSDGIIDEENMMIGLDFPFATEVKDEDIKHWVVDFGEKLKKVIVR